MPLLVTTIPLGSMATEVAEVVMVETDEGTTPLPAMVARILFEISYTRIKFALETKI